MEKVVTCWQFGGELADRKAIAEEFAAACAKGMHRKGILPGATFGPISIELVAQRQPGWNEMAAMHTTPELRLVKA